VKCADIPEDVFLAVVEAVPPMSPGGCWRHRRDVQAELERRLGVPLPEKLFLAKARRLGQRRRLEGCTSCTCRGDYHLPRECRRYGCCYDSRFDWRAHPEYDPSWEVDEPPSRDPEAFRRTREDLIRIGQAVAPLPPTGLVAFDLGPAYREPWLTPVASPLRSGQP
jgi:hypothetical protein